MMKFTKTTKNSKLRPGASDLSRIVWSIDASFAVHPDMRSHTGMTVMFEDGRGAVQSGSAKQKLNTDSSTMAEPAGGRAGPRGSSYGASNRGGAGRPADVALATTLCNRNGAL